MARLRWHLPHPCSIQLQSDQIATDTNWYAHHSCLVTEVESNLLPLVFFLHRIALGLSHAEKDGARAAERYVHEKDTDSILV